MTAGVSVLHPAQAARPVQPIQPSRRLAWPLGLVGAIALIAAGERYVASRQDEMGSIYSVEWRRNARAIRRHAAGTGVLCFGTSLSRMGVSPRVLEERTGMPAYNFAASGAQPFACYLALRDALASGARPRAIVVDFAWTTLGLPHSFNEVGLAEVATLGDLVAFAVSARDASLLGRMALGWLLPSYRARPEIRANIAAAVAGAEPSLNPERFLYAQNTEINRGAFHQGSIGFDGAIDPSNPVMFPRDWSCSEASRRYIDEFFRLAAGRDVPVFWIITPLAPGAGDAWAASGARARYMGLVDAMASRHPNVTVVDATGSRYPVAAFNDPVHLNRDGAVVFSADLADALGSRLATDGNPAPRRVRLPDYRPDPTAGRVEDAGTTLARLRAALGATRR